MNVENQTRFLPATAAALILLAAGWWTGVARAQTDSTYCLISQPRMDATP